MSAHRAYKRLVDEFVAIAGRSTSAHRIRSHGHPVRTNESALPLTKAESDLRSVFNKLSDDERHVLARAFEEERMSSIHDVAAFFEWALSTQNMQIEWDGEQIPRSPFEGMNGDFVSRLAGHDWPSSSGA